MDVAGKENVAGPAKDVVRALSIDSGSDR